ncbi:MAG: toxin-antitoxin system YwqK family antitoxin [bacterium]
MNKCLILVAALIMGSVSYAQNNKKVEKVKKGDLIEATYFYDNGVVEQEGTFKDGKLHGVWTSYDLKGNKVAVGEYVLGQKTGKWFFWSGTTLKEVDYSNNKVANVSEWSSKEVIVSRNK